jgi:hypothetical protein
MNECRQLQLPSSEKGKKSEMNTLGSNKDRPEEAGSNIIGDANDMDPHPTEGEKQHLHPNRKKGQVI